MNTMRQILVATDHLPLQLALETLAERYGVAVVLPENFADLACGDAVALVIDPHCLQAAEWQTYLDYLSDLGGEDSTPLVLLTRRDDPAPSLLPARLESKPDGTLHQCAVDELAAISALVEEALLGTRNQWNLLPRGCMAPGLLELEEMYLSVHDLGHYVVTIVRPDATSEGLEIFGRLAEQAGIETVDWASAAFLAFPFAEETTARQFMARLPAGMAMLYRQGKYLDVNA